jgi:hypothetical protein
MLCHWLASQEHLALSDEKCLVIFKIILKKCYEWKLEPKCDEKISINLFLFSKNSKNSEKYKNIAIEYVPPLDI